MHLNNPKTLPLSTSLWKNCLPQNLSLVPKRLGTTGVNDEGTSTQSPTSALQCSVSTGNNRSNSTVSAPFSHQFGKRNMYSKTDFLLSYPLMPWSTPANHHISSPLKASHSQAHTGDVPTACSYCQGLVSTKLPLLGPMAGGRGKPACFPTHSRFSFQRPS